MKNSLTENDLKCGMIAYEVTELYINTVLFVSDIYILVKVWVVNVLIISHFTRKMII